jgi:hypothetical protein
VPVGLELVGVLAAFPVTRLLVGVGVEIRLLDKVIEPAVAVEIAEADLLGAGVALELEAEERGSHRR